MYVGGIHTICNFSLEPNDKVKIQNLMVRYKNQANQHTDGVIVFDNQQRSITHYLIENWLNLQYCKYIIEVIPILYQA